MSPGGHHRRHGVTRHGEPMSEAQGFIAMYPDTARWYVRCVACGREGHDPALPYESIGGAQLARIVGPLELDDRLLCEQCGAAVDRRIH